MDVQYFHWVAVEVESSEKERRQKPERRAGAPLTFALMVENANGY